MKKTAWLIAILFLLGTFCGCTAKSSRSSSFFLMDTTITVTLYTTDDAYAEEIFDACRDMLSELERLWSHTVTESEVSRFNASASGIADLDSRTAALLATALDVNAQTEGAFDITVAPLVTLWETCGVENRLPTDSELTDVLRLADASALTLRENALSKSVADLQIDLGGIGKGAAIQYLIEYLESTDVAGGLVSFGSNIAVFGNKPNGDPFRIALRDPQDTNGTVGTLLLETGEILSVSGDYERYVTIDGVRYHHILDPATGYPAQNGLASVAVITRDGALADALSTALFVMGEEDAIVFYESGVYDFEAIFISHGGEITVTSGFADRFDENK